MSRIMRKSRSERLAAQFREIFRSKIQWQNDRMEAKQLNWLGKPSELGKSSGWAHKVGYYLYIIDQNQVGWADQMECNVQAEGQNQESQARHVQCNVQADVEYQDSMQIEELLVSSNSLPRLTFLNKDFRHGICINHDLLTSDKLSWFGLV